MIENVPNVCFEIVPKAKDLERPNTVAVKLRCTDHETKTAAAQRNTGRTGKGQTPTKTLSNVASETLERETLCTKLSH